MGIVSTVFTPLAAIAAALLVSALILLLSGYDPVTAYAAMWKGAFADLRTISELLIKATPLILIAAGLAVAFRASIWNIGAEGQFYAGAVAATALGIYLPNMPAFLHVPIVLLGAGAAGALWGMLAGWLKVRFNASEIVTTIMLNYIAIIATGWLVTGPMIEGAGKYPQTAKIFESAMLPRFLPPTRLHLGFIIALLVCVGLYILLFKTSAGYAIRAVGINADAARYAGINTTANIVLGMTLSGALAGLAGANEILAVNRSMALGLSAGYGFDSIALALLGNTTPLGTVLASLLFGVLRNGATRMMVVSKIPIDIITIVQALVLVFVAAPAIIRGLYRIKLPKEAETTVTVTSWGGNK